MRPIDADALVDMLQNLEDKLDKKAFHDMDFRASYISGIVQEIKNRVIEAPTLDYAPVRHGEWEWDTLDVYMCSACGEKSHVKEVIGRPDWDYCPNCGAKMDGGKADE